LLRSLRLFEALDPPALESLARSGTWYDVGPGTVIIREGEPGDRFYVLESGAVEVSRGGAAIRTLASPGDGFGEIALLRDVPRTATVTALQPSVLLAIGRAEFLAAVTGHPVVSAEAGRVVDAHLLADRNAGD
jgi:CRP-like cAMP-binding protein